MRVGFSIAGIGIALSGGVEATRRLGPCYAKFRDDSASDIRLSVSSRDWLASAHGTRPTIEKRGSILHMADGVFYDAEIDTRRGTGVLVHRRSEPLRHGHRFPLGLHLALKCLIASLLPARGQVLLHACGISLSGHGIVAVGKSGVGKTTVARMPGWETVLNDEIVAAGHRGNFAVAQSTPFSNEWRSPIENAVVPFSCGLVLRQRNRTSATLLDSTGFVSHMAQAICLPAGEPWLESQAFNVAITLAAEVPGYMFDFEKDARAVSNLVADLVAREGLP